MTIRSVSDSHATLRDQFAMAALTGLLASRPYNSGFSVDDNVDDSFDYADAMLEARLKRESGCE